MQNTMKEKSKQKLLKKILKINMLNLLKKLLLVKQQTRLTMLLDGLILHNNLVGCQHRKMLILQVIRVVIRYKVLQIFLMNLIIDHIVDNHQEDNKKGVILNEWKWIFNTG